MPERHERLAVPRALPRVCSDSRARAGLRSPCPQFVVQKHTMLAILLQCVRRFGPRSMWAASHEAHLQALRREQRAALRRRLAELERHRCDAKGQAVDVFEKLAPHLAKRARALRKVCLHAMCPSLAARVILASTPRMRLCGMLACIPH